MAPRARPADRSVRAVGIVRDLSVEWGGPRGLYNEHFLKKSIFANPKIGDYDIGPTVEAQARGLSTCES